MENTDCWIFVGGEHPNTQVVSHLLQAPLIIAADSGCRSAVDLGYTPDYVVGDFDSIEVITVQQLIPDDHILISPRDKEFSDTELALQLAEKLGAKSPVLLGGGAGRMDHLLAITKIFNGNYRPSYWITGCERIFLIEGEAILDENEGVTISFFPLQNAPEKVISDGLVWELDKVAWRDGKFSLSNRIRKTPTRINCQNGQLLAIIPNDSAL